MYQFAGVLASTLSLILPPNPPSWIGEWSNRGDRHNFVVTLELMKGGRFDWTQVVLSQGRPSPVIYYTGTWKASDRQITLETERRALIYDSSFGKSSIDRVTEKIELSIDGPSISTSFPSGNPSVPALKFSLTRRSDVPKPTDWAKLTRTVKASARPGP